jgi:hypothetical protein
VPVTGLASLFLRRCKNLKLFSGCVFLIPDFIQFCAYQQTGSPCLFCVGGVLNGRQRLGRPREDTSYSVRLGVDIPLGDRNTAMSSNTSKGNEADFVPLVVATNKTWPGFESAYGVHVARRIAEVCVRIDFDRAVIADPEPDENMPDAIDLALEGYAKTPSACRQPHLAA